MVISLLIVQGYSLTTINDCLLMWGWDWVIRSNCLKNTWDSNQHYLVVNCENRVMNMTAYYVTNRVSNPWFKRSCSPITILGQDNGTCLSWTAAGCSGWPLCVGQHLLYRSYFHVIFQQHISESSLTIGEPPSLVQWVYWRELRRGNIRLLQIYDGICSGQMSSMVSVSDLVCSDAFEDCHCFAGWPKKLLHHIQITCYFTVMQSIMMPLMVSKPSQPQMDPFVQGGAPSL